MISLKEKYRQSSENAKIIAIDLTVDGLLAGKKYLYDDLSLYKIADDEFEAKNNRSGTKTKFIEANDAVVYFVKQHWK